MNAVGGTPSVRRPDGPTFRSCAEKIDEIFGLDNTYGISDYSIFTADYGSEIWEIVYPK
jgi:hypothetical protein